MTSHSPPAISSCSYWNSPRTFTRKEVMNHTDWTKTRLHIHLTELIEMELVLPESTKKNQLPTYKLLYNGEDQDGRRFVLGLHGVQ